MKISLIEIQNFRKLKSCRVELGERETIFVGANNSGKTSAIDAMILFLKKTRRKEISVSDFTLSNWKRVNLIGESWISGNDSSEADLTISPWLKELPSLDVWLEVAEHDVHRIVHLLPTLNWSSDSNLGVRLLFAPKDLELLYKNFRELYLDARSKEQSVSDSNGSVLSLWPVSMQDFLDQKLHTYFEVKTYILDPVKLTKPLAGVAQPQEIIDTEFDMDKEPFEGLFKVDVISAQRGFSDPKTEDDNAVGFSSLSSQLRSYFSKHLDPTKAPETADLEALQAIEAAKTMFDDRLAKSFEPAICELEGLNYPGFSDPKIKLTSKINPIDTLNHKSAVRFGLPGVEHFSLPETYNGLGYQNLISMVFNLIRFRDEWMRVGKAKTEDGDGSPIEPLHIVLIEEPEAHLHVQVQQIFIKKAYEVLREHPNLVGEELSTQMLVSTHSSDIAHEIDFTCLRYFRREPAGKIEDVPSTTVVNLSETFGSETDTSKFSTRYLKSNDCDLFFADAVILVEGAAERMLVPHFVRSDFKKLDQSFVTLLEIGGAHAHRLRPLLEDLGLLTLVVTDLDSIGENDGKKVLPERGKNYRTGNTTIKTWVPQKEKLDELFDLDGDQKVSESGLIRVAYQSPINLEFIKNTVEEATPYTFEDSLALSNFEMFLSYDSPTGLLKKISDALKASTLSESSQNMFKSLEKGSKAELALELLYCSDPSSLQTPAYIHEGLSWLQSTLELRKTDVLIAETNELLIAQENG